MTRKVTEKKPASDVKAGTSKKGSPKKGVKMRKYKRGRIGSRPKLGGGSDGPKIALLSVVLVAAVAFIINSLGIVDFGRLLGFSEPTKKESIKPRAAKRSPAKTDKKPTRVATKSPQKTTSRQAPQKATSPRRRLVIKKTPRSTIARKRPVVVKKPHQPTTSTQKSVVPQKSSKPITSTPRPVVAKKPPQTSASKQNPVVAKRPPEPAISKAKPHVVKETPKPAEHTQKKGVSAKGALPPEGRIFSYPYSVYLGSYKTRETAQKAISGYRKKGFSPYWVKVDLGDKGVWYRVFTGQFKNRDSAEAFIKEKELVDARVKKTKHAVMRSAYSKTDDLTKKEDSDKKEFLLKATALSYPYSVYLGSYKTRERAQKAISGYRKNGFSPYWVKVDLGDKGVWYRVFTGHFENKEKAEEFIKERQLSDAKVKKPRYANLIGTYKSEKELNNRKVALSALGYCPYVIDGVNAESLLYTGAFYQKTRAEEQRAELASKGIESHVVER